MATIAATEHIQDANGRTIGWIWENADSDDTLTPARITNSNDLTLSVSGTIGSPAADITLLMSNHGPATGLFPATDAISGATLTTSAIDVGILIGQTGICFQPVISVGTGENLNIVIAGK